MKECDEWMMTHYCWPVTSNSARLSSRCEPSPTPDRKRLGPGGRARRSRTMLKHVAYITMLVRNQDKALDFTQTSWVSRNGGTCRRPTEDDFSPLAFHG